MIAGANRWDEKAGLRTGCCTLPSYRRARSARDKGDRQRRRLALQQESRTGISPGRSLASTSNFASLGIRSIVFFSCCDKWWTLEQKLQSLRFYSGCVQGSASTVRSDKSNPHYVATENTR